MFRDDRDAMALRAAALEQEVDELRARAAGNDEIRAKLEELQAALTETRAGSKAREEALHHAGA